MDEDIQFVAINDILSVDHFLYLLKYDSMHGGFQGHISRTAASLDISGKDIRRSQVEID